MNLVQTNAGALKVIQLALGTTPSIRCHLFDNNYSVVLATVLGDLTEASFTGYASVLPTWTAFAMVGAYATSTPTPTNVDFVYSGGSTVTVYGTFFTDSASAYLLGASTFAAPFVFSTVITTLSIYPTYTQKSEFTTS